MKNNMKKALVALLLLLTASVGRAQLLSVKTNLLMDAACVGNLGLELATGNRTSVAIDGYYSYKIYGTPARNYAFEPQFRYWINGRTFSNWYVGVGPHIGHFNIEAKKHHYVGTTYGAGANFGYDLWLSTHFSLDFHAGLGAYRYMNDRTDYNSAYEISEKYEKKGWTLLPYQVGISLVYVIK